MRSAAVSSRPAFIALGDSWRLQLSGTCELWPKLTVEEAPLGPCLRQAFAAEQPLLRPLPAERFETGLWLTPRVDRYAQITVRQCLYSVPARLVGRRVRALLRAVN
jgi:hypothetical protein